MPSGGGLLGRFLRLVESQSEGIGHAQNFSGGAHFRSQDRIDFREHIEGEHGFFHAEMGNDFVA